MSVRSINFEVIKKEPIANILADPTVNKENLLEVFLQHGSEVERSADLLGKLLQVLEKSSGELSPSICQRITSAFQRTIQYEDNQWQYTAPQELREKQGVKRELHDFVNELEGLYKGASPPEKRKIEVQILKTMLKIPGWNANQVNEHGMTRLMLACQNGHFEMVNLLLENGADPKLTDKKGNTALHFAASVEIAKLLLEKGADINQKNANREVPFITAYRQNHFEVFKFLLLEKGADLHQTTLHGETALLLASGIGDLELMKFLLEKNVNIDQKNQFGFNSLMAACERNHHKAAKFLLERGADLTLADKNGNTALHYAKSVEIAKLLLQRGAKINQRNNKGEIPFMRAYMQKHFEVFKFLLQQEEANLKRTNFEGCTAILFASQTNDSELVQWLLNKGLEVNQLSSDGSTPLMVACKNNCPDTVKLLLEKGADPNLKDIKENTALHFAKSIEIAAPLLKKGADSNQKNQEGKAPPITASIERRLDIFKLLLKEEKDTALFIASRIGDVDVIQWLLDQGLDVNQLSVDGATPLMIACKHNRPETVKLLLEKGADPNVVDAAGQTAMHVASCTGSLEVIEALLSKNVEINCQNHNRMTPIMLACRNNYFEAFKLLLERGADLNLVNKEGKTILYHAILARNIEVMKLLLEKGLHVNHQDKQGKTPLMQACEEGFVQGVKYLLEKGADPAIQTFPGLSFTGQSALHYAVENDNFFRDIILTLLATRKSFPEEDLQELMEAMGEIEGWDEKEEAEIKKWNEKIMKELLYQENLGEIPGELIQNIPTPIAELISPHIGTKDLHQFKETLVMASYVALSKENESFEALKSSLHKRIDTFWKDRYISFMKDFETSENKENLLAEARQMKGLIDYICLYLKRSLGECPNEFLVLRNQFSELLTKESAKLLFENKKSIQSLEEDYLENDVFLILANWQVIAQGNREEYYQGKLGNKDAEVILYREVPSGKELRDKLGIDERIEWLLQTKAPKDQLITEVKAKALGLPKDHPLCQALALLIPPPKESEMTPEVSEEALSVETSSEISKELEDDLIKGERAVNIEKLRSFLSDKSL